MKFQSYVRLLSWSLGVVCYLTWVGNAYSTTTADPRGVAAKNLKKRTAQEPTCRIQGKIQSLKEKGPSIEIQVFYELMVQSSDCGVKKNTVVEVLIPGAEPSVQGGYRFSADFKSSTVTGDTISLQVRRLIGVNTFTKQAFDHWVMQ